MEVSVSFLKNGDYSSYIDSINKSNADYIHYDVMDGKFVDNTNLKSLKEFEKYIKLAKKKIDVHLMVSNPLKYIEMLSLYNINNITIHREIKNYEDMIDLIKSYGIKAGIAINPETDISLLNNVLEKVDLVLVMGVHPGKSGQKFIEKTVEKINDLKLLRESKKLKFKISIDGGVCEEVLPFITNSDIIVSASYLLDNLDNINKIKEM